MKELTLRVPDQKIEFFVELIQQLGFEITSNVSIPEEHIEIVRDRISKSNAQPNRLLDWDKMQDNFNLD